MIKKLKKEDCIFLLKNKYKLIKSKGENRYPRRNDFTERQVVAIKAFLGPWPRALEIAGIKPIKEKVSELTKKEKFIHQQAQHSFYNSELYAQRNAANPNIVYFPWQDPDMILRVKD